jgi:hypothetical protein
MKIMYIESKLELRRFKTVCWCLNDQLLPQSNLRLAIIFWWHQINYQMISISPWGTCCRRWDQKTSWRHFSSVDIAPRKRSCAFFYRIFPKRKHCLCRCPADFSYAKPMRSWELCFWCMIIEVLVKPYQNKWVILGHELTENNVRK